MILSILSEVDVFRGDFFIAAATTVGSKQTGTMTEQAALIGADIAKKAKKAKVTTIVFDRNGRKYAQRLAALADAVRAEGVEF